MRQITKKGAHLCYIHVCSARNASTVPTRRRSQDYGECDLDVRASNPGAWDSAQPILPDES